MKRLSCRTWSRAAVLLVGAFLVYATPVARGQEAGPYGGKAPTDYPKFVWPDGKRAGLSLTFDDARTSQLENGVPLLNRHGVRATFYVNTGPFLKDLEKWRAAAREGHEIGNHSMNHPCSGNFGWAQNRALEFLSWEGITAEIEGTSRAIEEALGSPPRSFAYPCGQSYVGRGSSRRSYVPLIAERFITGRAWRNEAANDPWFCDLSHLMGQELDGLSFAEARLLIEEAAAEGKWIILAGHDIGDSGRQTVLTKTLDEICRYATPPESGLWLETVGKIGSYVSEQRRRLERSGP